MDRHQLGYVSTQSFGYWVEDNCGYTIDPVDMMALEESLDGTADHRIMKKSFIEGVQAYVDEEPDVYGDVLSAFQAFDQNGDGFISADELKDVINTLQGKKLSEEEIAQGGVKS